MEKRLLVLAAFIGMVSLMFAFRSGQGNAQNSIIQGGITGKVSPPDGGISVWAASTTDTVRGLISSVGSFSLQVKPGTYRLFIDAKEPFKDVTLENLEVKDQPLDVGEIVLQ
ncbi:MAG: hypothetical protein ABS85_12650 [Sphingobacteriales bacterium SCN 48-20]|jgi:hypothetical protein|uniref:hypothetical protein n=1 Tax=Terrimonas ferruginea TaxID=249 RepID=UPI00048E8B69|nr:hypothetical protein [Terrimonas ferruginea]MBN8782599.1 carboxypeptidase regulatory-like domain-containing protein [Terrimonas ferruginea]ODT91416.1 MAG: hypothetical protein ABS85_12650 [Sphingobacteriales bacterium SCN 48-20]OJW43100.1 MAG: hypothetical protein BGO56_13855 [Sphingobacteriales bacterium 48-107]